MSQLIKTLFVLAIITTPSFQACGYSILKKQYGSQVHSNPKGYHHDTYLPTEITGPVPLRMLQQTKYLRNYRIGLDYETQSDKFIQQNSQFTNAYAISKRIFTSIVKFLSDIVQVNTPENLSIPQGNCSG
jgi:hypothetical protein